MVVPVRLQQRPQRRQKTSETEAVASERKQTQSLSTAGSANSTCQRVEHESSRTRASRKNRSSNPSYFRPFGKGGYSLGKSRGEDATEATGDSAGGGREHLRRP